MSGEMTFANAALKYSTDKDTKQNGGIIVNPSNNTTKWELSELGEMDQNLVFMLENQMKVGDVSPIIQHVVDAKPCWRIVYLKSRTDPHKANLTDDYTKILNMAIFNRNKTLIKNWISKKSKSTYIKIDEGEFKTCPLEYNWTINQ